jgi:hypothetical protein
MRRAAARPQDASATRRYAALINPRLITRIDRAIGERC